MSIWKPKGCVAVVLCYLCSLLGQVSNQNSLNHVADTPSLSKNETIYLEASPEFSTFTVQNTTVGINLTITPLCPKTSSTCEQPQSLTINNVFLSPACALSPCDLLVNQTSINETALQNIIGIPSHRSIVLLKLHLNRRTRCTLLVDWTILSIIPDCSPATFIYMYSDEVYNVLCFDSNAEITLLQLDNLDNFKQVAIEVLMSRIVPPKPPIVDVTTYNSDSLDLHWLFISSGISVLQLDLEADENSPQDFSSCTGAIHYMKLANQTDSDDQVPYFLYCKENYLLLEYGTDDSPSVYDYPYSEYGYPVICKNSDNPIAKLVITQHNSTYILSYNNEHLEFSGNISLEESFCFGLEDSLFFVYTDRNLATYVIDLHDFSHGKIELDCDPSFCFTYTALFEDRYVLIQNIYSSGNATLMLYDAGQKTQIAVKAVEKQSNFMHLLVLPQEQVNYTNTIIGSTTTGGSVLLLALIGLVIRRAYRNRNQDYAQFQGEQPVDQDHKGAYVPTGPGSNRTQPSVNSTVVPDFQPVTTSATSQEVSNNPSEIVTGSDAALVSLPEYPATSV